LRCLKLGYRMFLVKLAHTRYLRSWSHDKTSPNSCHRKDSCQSSRRARRTRPSAPIGANYRRALLTCPGFSHLGLVEGLALPFGKKQYRRAGFRKRKRTRSRARRIARLLNRPASAYSRGNAGSSQAEGVGNQSSRVAYSGAKQPAITERNRPSSRDYLAIDRATAV
jgi:hypothetical protein